MDKVTSKFAEIPLLLLIAAPIAALLFYFLLPRHLKLYIMIGLMVVWLVVGRLVGLGTIYSATKATEFLVIAGVCLAAATHPGPRRRLPAVIWLYPVMAMIAFVYILTVESFILALALRVQWMLMVCAAMLIVRTIVDEASLVRVLKAFLYPLVFCLVIPMADLLLHPGEAFRAGLHRFEPWDTNSNQIGVLFSLATPMCVYFAIRSTRKIEKLALLGAGAMSMGMGLLTGSRSTMITMMGPLIPVAWSMRRNPLLLATGAVVGVIGLAFVISKAEHTAFDRFDSLSTSRTDLAVEYLSESIAKRPIFGLLGTQGMSALQDTEVAGEHPHNAYLEITYLGGLSYSGPMIAMAVFSGLSAASVWFRRARLPADPSLITFLTAQLAVIYAHGFVNGAIYYPTYEWTVMHLILAMFFVTVASDLKRGEPGLLAAPAWDDSEHSQHSHSEFGGGTLAA